MEIKIIILILCYQKNRVMKTTVLSERNVYDYIDKTITWHVTGYYDQRYEGKFIIRQVDNNLSRPIIGDVVDGDNLAYAFLSLERFQEIDNDLYVSDDNGNKIFCLSDDYRFVNITNVEE